MYHYYKPSTGELAGVSYGSDQLVQLWEAGGFVVIPDAPAVDAQGREIKLETHNYLGGALTPKVLVTLTPDKTQIAADGADQAVVAVAGQDPSASIEVLVAGQPRTVQLTNGAGQLQPLFTTTPTTFEVRVADQVRYWDNGGCLITAEEA